MSCRSVRPAAVCAVLIALISACAVPPEGGRRTRAMESGAGHDLFLDLELEDPHGRAIHLADFEGMVRVVDVWATWCAPCREAIPHLNTIYERYRDQGVVVLGISIDSGPAEVLAFQRSVPIRYPNGMFNPAVESLIGAPSAVPTTLLIDRAGAVRRTYLGLFDVATLESEIRGLL